MIISKSRNYQFKIVNNIIYNVAQGFPTDGPRVNYFGLSTIAKSGIN